MERLKTPGYRACARCVVPTMWPPGQVEQIADKDREGFLGAIKARYDITVEQLINEVVHARLVCERTYRGPSIAPILIISLAAEKKQGLANRTYKMLASLENRNFKMEVPHRSSLEFECPALEHGERIRD